MTSLKCLFAGHKYRMLYKRYDFKANKYIVIFACDRCDKAKKVIYDPKDFYRDEGVI